MLKKVAIGVGVLLALLFAVVASRPSEFRIERSKELSAPADAVFPHLDDFHKWQAWSPWEKLDPNLKRQFSGSQFGAGAVYEWQGNDQVGSGRMTIIESRAPSLIKVKLEFLSPWEATNTTVFALQPNGSGSKLTWSMEGENNFMAKAFSLFMDMDELVGKDFEAGLSNLEQVTKAAPASAQSP